MRFSVPSALGPFSLVLAKVTVEVHPLVLLILGIGGVAMLLRRHELARHQTRSMTPRGPAPRWLARANLIPVVLFGIVFVILGFGGAVYSFFD